MSRPTISAYTPSNTDPERLKRIFVQREKMLTRIVERLSRSMQTGDKHHILLVGPRGSGKTHLVSLAAWELQQRDQLGDVMRIAWLGEDDSFTGLIHLAFGIASQLAAEYPGEFPSDFKTSVRGLPPDDAALSVLNSTIERLGHRSLLLITENMDQTFRSLGDTGRKKWRAFLQETKKIATLATSQQLFAGVSDRNEAFFGFFDIQHLEPLSVDDARELIRRISVEQDKPDLIDYLNSNEGRYRIRALHYLAGGNHRMYVLLAEFLTKESLDDLVAAFENLAHDMTPYFQERVRSLPDQQRQLVQCLCDTDGGLTVKEVAEETFIDERSCSKQLGNLKSKGYVRSEKRGKESYYDMAEPLMRLCLEVKNQRGKPLRMVARFLRAWFPLADLQVTNVGDDEASRVNAYRLAALQSGDHFQSAIAEKLTTEIRSNMASGEFDVAKSLAEELNYADDFVAPMIEAELAFKQGDTELAVTKLSTIIENPKTPAELKAKAFFHRGAMYGQQGDLEGAIADLSAAVDMPDTPAYQKATALCIRGFAHFLKDNSKGAIADLSAVVDMPDTPAYQKAIALVNRGAMYGQQGDAERAIADYSAVIEMPAADRKAKALFNRGATYSQQGDAERAIADYSAVIEMPDAPADPKAQALFNRGVTYSRQGDVESEIADYSAVVEMPDAPPDLKAQALVNRGSVNWSLQQYGDSISDFRSALAIATASTEQRTKALFALPGPMVEHHTSDEVVSALAGAFENADRESGSYGGTPDDLLWMLLRRSSDQWRDYSAKLVPLYVQYGVAEKLGQGITRSIQHLDEGGYSESQIHAWNAAWQEAGKECEDLQIPLACLQAATEVIISDPKTDRPLFQLPLEIRRLVRPLLNHSLGKIE